jgi:hypothetical protein
MHATCPTYLILLHLITLIICDEAPHYAATSSPLVPSILSTLSLCSYLICKGLDFRPSIMGAVIVYRI